MGSVKRPLSPHLQIYKPQLTSILSITHRGTGIFLSLGALMLSCWLVGIASGEQTFNDLQQHINAWYGKIVLIAFIFSIYYHLANGIRHLFWDVGMGLEMTTTYKSAYVVVAMTVLLTIITISYGDLL